MKSDLQRWQERQRAEHMLGYWLPIVLFFAGLPGWIVPSRVTFDTTLAIGAASGLAALYLVVFRQNGVRLSWLLASGLLLGYLGGASNTEIALTTQGTNMADYFGRIQGDLCDSASIIVWVCAVLFLIGGMCESPLTVRIRRLTAGDPRILWFGLGFILLSFLTGKLVFDGAKVAADQRVTAMGELSAIALQILPGATIILLANSKWSRRTALLLLMILAECCLMILIGRRVLMYGLVIACLAASIAGLRLNLSRGKKIGLGIAAVILVAFGMQFFFAMRVTNWRLGSVDDLTTGQLLSKTLETMTDKGDSSVSDALAQNLRDRTSIILYLCDLITASKTYPPLYGADAVYSVKRAIPSALYANKEDVLMSEETLANPRFGLIIEDDANSILTTGASDFGVLGCFAYPLLSIVFFRVLLWFMQSKMPESAYVVALLIILTQVIQAESALAAYMEIAREAVLFAIVITIAKAWPALRRRRAGRKLYASMAPAGHITA